MRRAIQVQVQSFARLLARPPLALASPTVSSRKAELRTQENLFGIITRRMRTTQEDLA